MVSYEILLDSKGGARADRVRAILPFSRHVKVGRTEFDHPATWVSSLGEDRITVMFGRVRGGEERRAKIFFGDQPGRTRGRPAPHAGHGALRG